MIADWLKIPYVKHGRDVTGCDCYGLVRLVRSALRGDHLAPHAGVDPADKFAMTAIAASTIAGGWPVVSPRPGAIAAVWRGDLCVHVAIVIKAEGRLAVLETNSRTGVRWLRLHDFEARYPRVTYHDQDL